MNNSLDRMIEGLTTTLREEVIPHVDTEFARGQAYGVIYMLNSIRMRASWDAELLGKQVAAQAELAAALSPLLEGLDPPALPNGAVENQESAGIEALRDENEARICALIEWHGAARRDAAQWQAIESLIRTYMDRQLKQELTNSARPMFAQMSAGEE